MKLVKVSVPFRGLLILYNRKIAESLTPELFPSPSGVC